MNAGADRQVRRTDNYNGGRLAAKRLLDVLGKTKTARDWSCSATRSAPKAPSSASRVSSITSRSKKSGQGPGRCFHGPVRRGDRR